MMSVIISGIMTPPLTPWTIRNTMRLVAFHASAHSTEPSRKNVSEPSQSRLPPTADWAQRTIGMVTNMASR